MVKSLDQQSSLWFAVPEFINMKILWLIHSIRYSLGPFCVIEKSAWLGPARNVQGYSRKNFHEQDKRQVEMGHESYCLLSHR